MAWLKFCADNLFDGTTLLDHHHVLISNEDGVIEEIVDRRDAGDDVRVLQGILSPGLINCHCHLELSHMKGLIPERTGLIDFVFKVVTQRHFATEEILEAVNNAEAEMLANGIVAVGDICNTPYTVDQKKQHRLAYYNFVEVSGWLPAVASDRFSQASDRYQAFASIASLHEDNNSIVPHAPYSVSEPLWNLMQPGFRQKTISIHNQETSFEDELFLSGEGHFIRMYEMMKLDCSFFTPTGKGSLPSYFDKLSNARNALLVHNTFTRQADIDFLKAHAANSPAVFFCLCINANLYIENQVPPVELLMENNCNIVLGTDSLASNWQLSILSEMQQLRKNFTSVPLNNLLQWATSNGAKALQMEDKLGSFERGKTPGIINISSDLEKAERLV